MLNFAKLASLLVVSWAITACGESVDPEIAGQPASTEEAGAVGSPQFESDLEGFSHVVFDGSEPVAIAMEDGTLLDIMDVETSDHRPIEKSVPVPQCFDYYEYMWFSGGCGTCRLEKNPPEHQKGRVEVGVIRDCNTCSGCAEWRSYSVGCGCCEWC